MSSLCRYAEATIAKCIAVVTKPRGGGKLELIQPLPRARCGSSHIRWRQARAVGVAEPAAAHPKNRVILEQDRRVAGRKSSRKSKPVRDTAPHGIA